MGVLFVATSWIGSRYANRGIEKICVVEVLKRFVWLAMTNPEKMLF